MKRMRADGQESLEKEDEKEEYRPFYWYDRDYNIPDECDMH